MCVPVQMISCHPSFTNTTAMQFSVAPFGALESFDLKTGIPWVAPLATNPVNGSTFGDGTGNPLGFTRSQLSELWFTAKELTVACPTGTSLISIPKIFNEYAGAALGIIGKNPFKTMGASFAFPLWYEMNVDDLGAPGVNRYLYLAISQALGPQEGSAKLFADSGLYYPSILFIDNDGTNDATTANVGGVVGQFNFMGSGLSCNLYGTVGAYGTVNVSITATW